MKIFGYELKLDKLGLNWFFTRSDRIWFLGADLHGQGLFLGFLYPSSLPGF